MNYTLNQIQVFLKVVETGSVTKAAESLHLTQPAVSIQLKNFQDQFELPLTEIVGRKIYITDSEKKLLKYQREYWSRSMPSITSHKHIRGNCSVN